MKSCEPLAFFADRNASICAEPIHTQIILIALEFLDFINSKRDGASVWFETLFDQGIYANSKFVIWIALLQTRGKLRSYDQARDAQWLLRTTLYNRSGFNKSPYNLAGGCLAFPIHGLHTRELLLSVQILRKEFVTVRFVLEFGHDLWCSIGQEKYSV